MDPQLPNIKKIRLLFFIKIFIEDLPYTKVPLHTVIKLTPMAYGCLMECIPLTIEAVNTHREKPKVRLTQRNS